MITYTLAQYELATLEPVGYHNHCAMYYRRDLEAKLEEARKAVAELEEATKYCAFELPNLPYADQARRVAHSARLALGDVDTYTDYFFDKK